MEGCGEAPRRELANLGNALTMAERGHGRSRLSPADLMAWLLRVARLHPAALAEGTLFQLCDAIAGDLVEDADKIALVRMSWAAIVRSEFKQRGLTTVEGGGVGARSLAGNKDTRISRI